MSKSDASKTNKNANRNKAVALRYRVDDDAAPVVIASGYGQIADKIIGIAEDKGIPVFKDDSAASMLCMLEVGRTIPTELYEVIAAIYMQILTVAHKAKQGSGPAPAAPISTDEIRQRLAGQRPGGDT